MRALFLMFLTAWPLSAAAEVFKCLDGRQRVTYSNLPCEKQGLKDAGPVADRTMTLPSPAPRPPANAAPAPARDPDAVTGGAGVKPASPLIEKLLK